MSRDITIQIKATPEITAKCKQMLADGVSQTKIAKILGITRYEIKVRVDPKFRSRAKQSRKRSLAKKKARIASGGDVQSLPSISKRIEMDAEKHMENIPPDTRDLTARLLGDPIPERSALHRKKMEESNDHQTLVGPVKGRKD